MYVIKFSTTPKGFTNTMVDVSSESLEELLSSLENTYNKAYHSELGIGDEGGCKIYRTHTGRPLYSIDHKFTFMLTEATYLKG